MLKRAGIAIVLALVAGLLGFTGLLQSTARIAQAFFIIVSAFAFLSFLFSLFEPGGAENRAKTFPISRSQPDD